MPAFFFNDTATTEIYTLSLHDALPISQGADRGERVAGQRGAEPGPAQSMVPAKRVAGVAVAISGALSDVSRSIRAVEFVCPELADRLERERTRLKLQHNQNSYARFFF